MFALLNPFYAFGCVNLKQHFIVPNTRPALSMCHFLSCVSSPDIDTASLCVNLDDDCEHSALANAETSTCRSHARLLFYSSFAQDSVGIRPVNP